MSLHADDHDINDSRLKSLLAPDFTLTHERERGNTLNFHFRSRRGLFLSSIPGGNRAFREYGFKFKMPLLILASVSNCQSHTSVDAVFSGGDRGSRCPRVRLVRGQEGAALAGAAVVGILGGALERER